MSLRVTPIYGSQFNIYGEAEEPTCTLVEFSNCRIIVNMGYNPTYWNTIHTTATSTNTISNNNSAGENETIIKRNQLPDHDCVFIMNSTWQCLGGLPIYYEYMQQLYQQNMITNIPPIYTTYPTIKMGQMTIYDYHATLAMDGNTGIPYTLSAIDNVFSSIIPIKYNQHIYISPSLSTSNSTSATGNESQHQHASKNIVAAPGSTAPQLSVTAHRAGYVVGAAYYVFQRLIDETIVLYTDSTYHMSKELHLEACTLLQSTAASSTSTSTTTILPDVLITRPGGPAFRQFRALYTNQMHSSSNNINSLSAQKNSKNSSKSKSQQQQQSTSSSILQPPPLVQQAERNLMETIMAVLRRDGNVLLPVDTSGRILELLLLLVKEWDTNKYHTSYNLIYYGYMCHNVLNYAKSQLEWMSQQLNTQFTDHGQHPYRFAASSSGSSNYSSKKIIHFCTSMSELNAILEEDAQNPSCIVASGLSMEGGPSRDALLKFADNPDNAILFTDSSQCYLRRTYYNISSTSSSSNIITTASESMTEKFMKENKISAPQQDSSMLNNPTILNDDGGILAMTNSTSTSTTTTNLAGPNIVGLDTTDTNEEGNDDVTNIGEALNANEAKSIWTTAGQLLQAWATAKAMGTEMADSVTIDVNVPIRAPLSGNELKLFLEQEESKRQAYIKAAEKRAMLAQVELAKGQLHLGEDDTTTQPLTTMSSSMVIDASKPSTIVTASSTTMVSLSSRSRPKKKSRFDSTLFLKFSKPLYSTYLFIYIYIYIKLERVRFHNILLLN